MMIKFGIMKVHHGRAVLLDVIVLCEVTGVQSDSAYTHDRMCWWKCCIYLLIFNELITWLTHDVSVVTFMRSDDGCHHHKRLDYFKNNMKDLQSAKFKFLSVAYHVIAYLWQWINYYVQKVASASCGSPTPRILHVEKHERACRHVVR